MSPGESVHLEDEHRGVRGPPPSLGPFSTGAKDGCQSEAKVTYIKPVPIATPPPLLTMYLGNLSQARNGRVTVAALALRAAQA
jgi:hypothetical protein